MRRTPLVSLIALSLLLAACGSTSGTRPTVTQVVTVTGTSPASTTGASITVVGPGASDSTGSSSTGQATTGTAASGTGSSATDTAAPSTGSATATGSGSSATGSTSGVASSVPIQTVSPLKVDCAALLDDRDVKKALGATISSASSRIVDVANPEREMTGRVKCYYGVQSDSQAHPVSIAIAQYSSPAAALAQVAVTIKSETGLGAKSSAATVSGQQATVLLRDGGLIVLPYDSWTLSIAVEATVSADAATLPDGLTGLATLVLARILKNG